MYVKERERERGKHKYRLFYNRFIQYIYIILYSLINGNIYLIILV